MNNAQDIARVIGDLETVGMYVTSKEVGNVSAEELREAYLNAAKKTEQAERELRALKLSKDDAKHLSLVRDAIRLTRRSLIAASEGKGAQAKVLILQASKKSAEYAFRKAKSQRRSPNG